MVLLHELELEAELPLARALLPQRLRLRVQRVELALEAQPRRARLFLGLPLRAAPLLFAFGHVPLELRDPAREPLLFLQQRQPLGLRLERLQLESLERRRELLFDAQLGPHLRQPLRLSLARRPRPRAQRFGLCALRPEFRLQPARPLG